jgi:hypothetical protein
MKRYLTKFLPQSMAKEKYNFFSLLFFASFSYKQERFMEEFFLRSAVENGKYKRGGEGRG